MADSRDQKLGADSIANIISQLKHHELDKVLKVFETANENIHQDQQQFPHLKGVDEKDNLDDEVQAKLAEVTVILNSLFDKRANYPALAGLYKGQQAQVVNFPNLFSVIKSDIKKISAAKGQDNAYPELLLCLDELEKPFKAK